MAAREDARVAHHRVKVVVDLEGTRPLREAVLVEVLQIVVRDRVAAGLVVKLLLPPDGRKKRPSLSKFYLINDVEICLMRLLSREGGRSSGTAGSFSSSSELPNPFVKALPC